MLVEGRAKLSNFFHNFLIATGIFAFLTLVLSVVFAINFYFFSLGTPYISLSSTALLPRAFVAAALFMLMLLDALFLVNFVVACIDFDKVVWLKLNYNIPWR